MPEELWTEVLDIVQGAVIKTTPKKNKCKKAKWLSGEALQSPQDTVSPEGTPPHPERVMEKNWTKREEVFLLLEQHAQVV